jgi:hypothetical protein
MLGRLTEARLGRRGPGRLNIAEALHLCKRELLTGRFQTRATLHAEVSWGGQYGDLIGTLEAGVYAVTSRFADLLLESHMTGWKTYPLAVNRSDSVPAPLWLLAIIGTCGPIYGVGGQPFAGMDGISQYLDPRRWDGSNFFLPDNRNSILVDDVAAKLLRSSGLENVLVEPAGLEPLPGTGT